jgi:hypothetical protein
MGDVMLAAPIPTEISYVYSHSFMLQIVHEWFLRDGGRRDANVVKSIGGGGRRYHERVTVVSAV